VPNGHPEPKAGLRRLMQERLPGLEVVHLDAGEMERRWAGVK
jgi:hypothetical protein